MRQLNEYKNAEINMKISLKRCRKKLGVTEREKKKREWVEREKEVNAYVSKTNLIYN